MWGGGREKGIRTVPGTARAEEDLRSGTDGLALAAGVDVLSLDFLPSFLPSLACAAICSWWLLVVPWAAGGVVG